MACLFCATLFNTDKVYLLEEKESTKPANPCPADNEVTPVWQPSLGPCHDHGTCILAQNRPSRASYPCSSSQEHAQHCSLNKWNNNFCHKSHTAQDNTTITRMRANAQRDGRPAEYRWRPQFKAAKFGWYPALECRAVTLPRRETL